MALLKEITTNTGVTTSYHIVKGLERNPFGTLSIFVSSYTDESYREKEKNAFEKIAEMQNNVASDYVEYLANTNLEVSRKEYRLSEAEDFSYKEAYDYLKTLDVFSGAEDA